jgi:aryl-alcohol dehydrogenase (NADP+)
LAEQASRSALYALGALMFATQVGNPDPEDSIRIIHKALDAGVRQFCR